MTVIRRKPLALLLLLGIALLSTRILGAHLHFCLDGQEPLVTLHGDDAGLHHDPAASGNPHDDRDAQLLTATPAKGQALVASAALFLVATIFALLRPAPQLRRLRIRASAWPDPTFRHLRPPLRGPPR